MAIRQRRRIATGLDHLQWIVSDDGSWTLWDDRLQESFHGSYGAVSESIIVYLVNSGVVDRFNNKVHTRVFEVGLGTATNMLLTAALAEVSKIHTEYFAVEPHLLTPAVLNRLELSRRLADSQLQSRVLATNASAAALFSPEFQASLERVTKNFLSKLAGEIVEPTLLPLGDYARLIVYPSTLDAAELNELRGAVDVVYFDAFSPKNSPELWTESIFRQMFDLLAEGGRLATYCVKGSVRQDMRKAGFEVQKQPGPQGGKREVLVASKRSGVG